MPSPAKLTAYQKTYLSFLDNIDTVMDEVKEKAFQRYQKLLAHYYENEAKSGIKPLGITDKEAHFPYMKNLNYIRILDNDTIKIRIHYDLDEEHGLEIRLENNAVAAIGGIAET